MPQVARHLPSPEKLREMATVYKVSAHCFPVSGSQNLTESFVSPAPPVARILPSGEYAAHLPPFGCVKRVRKRRAVVSQSSCVPSYLARASVLPSGANARPQMKEPVEVDQVSPVARWRTSAIPEGWPSLVSLAVN